WGEGRLPQTVTLGTDQLIEGFDEGLVDLPVGSEVMLVVPPSLGFGPSGNELATETLVYVVDILAVSPPA
ncbi:FKBP-type peptidyl-prolyl cis-trans isomerase, partial [Anoxybacillus sp. LAT_38]|nr:FKBP-type peptidyl-prolyl cis-trans isomerase [Anoxybacillus sp. LAT_38]